MSDLYEEYLRLNPPKSADEQAMDDNSIVIALGVRANTFNHVWVTHRSKRNMSKEYRRLVRYFGEAA